MIEYSISFLDNFSLCLHCSVLITLFRPNKIEYVVNELLSISMNCTLYASIIMTIDDICSTFMSFETNSIITDPNIYDIIHVSFISGEYVSIFYLKSHLLSFILSTIFIIIICVIFG